MEQIIKLLKQNASWDDIITSLDPKCSQVTNDKITITIDNSGNNTPSYKLGTEYTIDIYNHRRLIIVVEPYVSCKSNIIGNKKYPRMSTISYRYYTYYHGKKYTSNIVTDYIDYIYEDLLKDIYHNSQEYISYIESKLWPNNTKNARKD